MALEGLESKVDTVDAANKEAAIPGTENIEFNSVKFEGSDDPNQTESNNDPNKTETTTETDTTNRGEKLIDNAVDFGVFNVSEIGNLYDQIKDQLPNNMGKGEIALGIAKLAQSSAFKGDLNRLETALGLDEGALQRYSSLDGVGAIDNTTNERKTDQEQNGMYNHVQIRVADNGTITLTPIEYNGTERIKRKPITVQYKKES